MEVYKIECGGKVYMTGAENMEQAEQFFIDEFRIKDNEAIRITRLNKNDNVNVAGVIIF